MSVTTPVAYMTRSLSISASHRLQSFHLTEAENWDLYGKCYNPNGHGHNYLIEVTLKGKVNPKTGMVYDLKRLKELMEEAITIQLDHKNIDLDVPYFKENKVISTTENLTIFVWHEMKKALKGDTNLLYKVVVRETDKNKFTYKGQIDDSSEK